MSNLAGIYASNGSYAEAKELYEACFDQVMVNCGLLPASFSVECYCFANWVVHVLPIAHLDSLSIHFDQRAESFGGDHPDTLDALAGVAVNEMNIGDYERAEQLFAMALPRMRFSQEQSKKFALRTSR
jgi:hypothetical protein